MQKEFDSVTLLVTHYNRSSSLERLLKTLKEQQIEFGDIIVSDDCSKDEHIDHLKKLQPVYHFKLITTPVNKGLGNNINKGQDAVTTPYTLYIQEDFKPLPNYKKHLTDALNIMNERPDIDMARFFAYFRYPYLKRLSNGFSEMYFSIWLPGYRKFHCYSDHPHLRRSDFLKKFGRYIEGIRSDRTEFLMSISFLKNKGKGIFYNDFEGLFEQINTNNEPSTIKRAGFRQSSNPIIASVRDVYRSVRHNFDFLVAKKVKSE